MKLSESFKNVERTALVLTPKKPFVDWLISHDPHFKGKEGVLNESDVYLLPDFETKEEMELWLKENFDWLFCEQLYNWYTDEDLWVQNRTFKLFQEWFHYSLHTMVFDSVAGPIRKLS